MGADERAREKRAASERAAAETKGARAQITLCVSLEEIREPRIPKQIEREERTLAAMRAIRCRVYMYNVRIRIESEGELQPLNGGAAANFCIPAGGMLGVGSE